MTYYTRNFSNLKWTSLILGMVVVLVFSLTSCEKDSFEPTNEPTENTEEVNTRSEEPGDGEVDPSAALAYLNEIPYGNIEVRNGMLVFASEDAIKTTIDLLEQAELTLDAEISNSVMGLSEDVVDAMEIDDEVIYTTFEEALNFHSLRAQKAAELEEFFSQEELDDSNDPEDKYAYAGPDFFQSILSPEGTVGVGATVNLVNPDRGNYTVLDGNPETIAFLQTLPEIEEIREHQNVQIIDDPEGLSPRSACTTKDRTATHYKNSSSYSYRLKLRVQVYNFSFFWWNTHRARSQAKSRKKRKRGWFRSWKKDHSYKTITQRGSVYRSTYYSIPCEYCYYDFDLQREICYWTTCTYERPCEGERVDAYKYKSGSSWRERADRNYTYKISASNKDGSSHILRGRFTWRGGTYHLAIL